MLAVRTGKSRKEVTEKLISLSRLRYIRYIPQKKTPFIVFTTSREETQFVSISRAVYEERKKRFEKRIHSMIGYVEEEAVCRSRMLLIYFDEKNPRDCGCCDVCLKKNETGLSNYEFRRIKEQVEMLLGDGQPRRINNLVDSVADENTEKVIRVIRFLIDAGELNLEDDRVSAKRSKNHR